MAALEVGTRDWMARTGGRLSGGEQARFLMVGMQSQMKQMPERVAAALGLRRDRLARIDLDDLRLPDSPAAREADELCSELEPHLQNHSRRSYLWAAILARHDKLDVDEEILYVGALLHDHGLPKALESRDSRCFTVTSAETAAEVARRHGWD
ncbi:MAG TPA: HD domain-containing protein, partial [Thermoleophilaceae bacterium]